MTADEPPSISTDSSATGTGPITFGTLVAFLVGSRTAIQKVAASRQATWYGLVLTLIAGVAREYDQEALLHEPWYLLIPVGASLLLNSILCVAVWGFDGTKWAVFLRCFWFCSPMALLYAIPVERWGDASWAFQANLTLLGIVSLWRVVLMARVAGVLRGRSTWYGLGYILWPVDTVAFLGLGYSLLNTELSPVEFMGRVQRTPLEELVSEVQEFLWTFTFWAWPVTAWLYRITITTAPLSEPTNPWAQTASGSPRIAMSCWGFVIASAIGLIMGCVIAQPEQMRRHHAEYLVNQGDIAGFVQDVQNATPDDFPSLWNPPPTEFSPRRREFIPILRGLGQSPAAPLWLIDIYQAKLVRHANSGNPSTHFWYRCSPEEIEALCDILDHCPELSQQFVTVDECSPISMYVLSFTRTTERGSDPAPSPETLLRLLKHASDLPKGPTVAEMEQKLRERIAQRSEP